MCFYISDKMEEIGIDVRDEVSLKVKLDWIFFKGRIKYHADYIVHRTLRAPFVCLQPQ